MTGSSFPPGVTELDHTADVGLEIRAGSPDALFHRAALGLRALVEAEEEGGGAGSGAGATGGRRTSEGAGGADSRFGRSLTLVAGDAAELLVRWLQEILHVQDVEAARYVDAAFDVLEPGRLEARVRFVAAAEPPVREVKGVTYHDLALRRDGDGWFARVIFDV